MRILDLLARRAAETPAAPAIEARRRRPLDYRGLLAVVEHCTSALRALGCGPGSRIAVVLEAGPEMATACLAVASAATCVPLNPSYTIAELEELLRRLRVRLMISEDRLVAARAAARAVGIPVLDLVRRARAGEFEISGRATPAPADAGQLAAGREQALVLHTSGSTARPKIVPLTHRNLLVSAANVARSLDLRAEDRCLATLPQFHVGALVDLLLAPFSAGGSVIVAAGAPAAVVLDCLQEARPTWYQAVPTMLHDLLHRAEVDGRDTTATSLRFVRSVSAPLPPALHRAFEARFRVPVIEIYGMTETAGVIASNPLPPGERRVGSVGRPAGPEVMVADAAGDPVLPGQKGEVMVRGANVFAGYEGESSAAEHAAENAAENAEGLTDGWLRTGDEGRFDDGGYLYLTGRVKEIINRGGEKIAPREIDEVVLAHPCVRDAAAFALPHPTLGEEVALAAVVEPGRNVESAELIAHCAARLAPFKVPRTVHFCAALPRTAGGKLQRRLLADTVRRPAAPTGQGASLPAALTDLERTLAALWRSALGIDEVGRDDDFFDLGGDSLRAAAFIEDLQRVLGRRVPIAALYDGPTIAALARRIEAPADAGAMSAPGARAVAMFAEVANALAGWKEPRPAADSLLVSRSHGVAGVPFFWCVQGHGEFALVADALGRRRPVYGMRSLFGLDSRSPDQLPLLVQHYVEEVVRLQPRGPLHLGGFCAGAEVALEVARGLIARGREVGLLCLVEFFKPVPYSGRLALFCCRSSRFQNYLDAAQVWRRYYTGVVSLYPTNGEHNDYFGQAAETERLVAQIEQELQGTPAGAGTGSGAAAIRVTAPRVRWSRAPTTVVVEIENRGAQAWPVSVLVRNRWRRGGRVRIASDGIGLLAEPVPPGARVRLELHIRVPFRPGWWQLEIGLADSARATDWFGGTPSGRPRSHAMAILPDAAVWSFVWQRLRNVLRAAGTPLSRWRGASAVPPPHP